MSSILLSCAKKVEDVTPPRTFVIYGPNGTGKTALASTFPKTKDKPMLYLDIGENGVASISYADRENIDVIQVEDADQFKTILDEIYDGVVTDDQGNNVKLEYSSLVIDGVTNLESFMKKKILADVGKSKMTLNEYGILSQDQNNILIDGLLTSIQKKYPEMYIVLVVHPKDDNDEDHPERNKVIPNVISGTAYKLCAKAENVWYTSIITDQVEDPTTNEVRTEETFVTYIGQQGGLLTKTRKPKEIKIPLKARDWSFAKYAALLSKINSVNKPKPAPVKETDKKSEPKKGSE